MTSVDELFKKTLGAGNSKRKFEPVQDPNELYKAAKLDSDDDVRSKGKAPMVEDDMEDDGEAGPELPPDMGEEDIPDDEEGRFFGGGMEQKTAEAMKYIDQQETDEAPPQRFDYAWVNRLSSTLEEKISKNTELRARFENDPQKFMASEADLDTEIKGLSILTEHPELYEKFAQCGCVRYLIQLLSHDNVDIAIDAIQIISELTDDDIEAEPWQWELLVQSFMDHDIIELLASNLTRLDENNESDRTGVYYILSVLENLCSQKEHVEQISEDTAILPWILARIKQSESPVSQNKQYATEVLAIMLQSSAVNRQKFIALDGVDAVLQLLSQYRRRDPIKDSNEEEYVENLFGSLICVVEEPSGKIKFLEAEGIELAQIMLKESKFSKPRALRVLNHLLGGASGAPACQHFVDANVLSTVFGMFMKKQDGQNMEHLLGVFASLLRHLPGQSVERIRTLAKFMEKDYAKIEKLVKLRRDQAARLAPVEQKIERERKMLMPQDDFSYADGWLAMRLTAGLVSLQTIDVILAWLVAEDDAAKQKIVSLLADRDEDLSLVRKTLQEQLGGLSDEDAEQKEVKEMLSTLIQFV